MAESNPTGEVILRNVRLSYPHLFEPQERLSDDGETRLVYSAAFLIPKEGDEFKNALAVRKAMKALMVEKYGPDETKHPRIPAERKCLRDGDEKDGEEYHGHWYVNANSSTKRPPTIITNRKGKDGKWIEAEPGGKGAPYGGCYVNAIITIWLQDHKKYGKRLNASIESVQFRRDGEPFGAGRVDPNSRFSDDDVDVIEDDDNAYDDDVYGDEDDMI
jgi:hypothetical protein